MEEGNLTQTVFLLRKVFGDSDSQTYIVNVPRQGYRFVGPVPARPGQTSDSVSPKTFLPAALKRFRWHALAIGALAGVAAWMTTFPQPHSAGSFTGPVRFEIPFADPAAAPLLSPDGRRIALVRLFQDASGTEGIWLRDLNGTAPYLLAGTENASSAFWSPDGCCLGFMAQGKLKTVNVSGGPANLVSNAPRGRGGAWNEAGTILFAPVAGGPLHSVPAKGGAEHYGNIVTYMRANGLVPPSSEGR